MAQAFSQVGVALSSGAFNYTTNIAQRERFDLEATSVPKAPVWFLAVVCALYALMALVVFIAALVLRGDKDTREAQRKLGLQNVDDIFLSNVKQAVAPLGDIASDSDSDDTAGRRHKKKGWGLLSR